MTSVVGSWVKIRLLGSSDFQVEKTDVMQTSRQDVSQPSCFWYVTQALWYTLVRVFCCYKVLGLWFLHNVPQRSQMATRGPTTSMAPSPHHQHRQLVQVCGVDRRFAFNYWVPRFHGLSRPDDTSSVASALARLDVTGMGRRHTPCNTTTTNYSIVVARSERLGRVESRQTSE